MCYANANSDSADSYGNLDADTYTDIYFDPHTHTNTDTDKYTVAHIYPYPIGHADEDSCAAKADLHSSSPNCPHDNGGGTSVRSECDAFDSISPE